MNMDAQMIQNHYLSLAKSHLSVSNLDSFRNIEHHPCSLTTYLQEVFEAVNEALKAVSSLVRGGFAGSKASMTVADLALMATYSSLRACKLVDHKSFWYVEAWFKRCRNQVRRKKGKYVH